MRERGERSQDVLSIKSSGSEEGNEQNGDLKVNWASVVQHLQDAQNP